MPYLTQFSSRAQDALLERSVAVFDGGGVASIDLDGVLFDTRSRQVQIVRKYAALTDDPRLLTIRPEHFLDWSMATTLEQMGLERSEAQKVWRDMRGFWEAHFFSAEAIGWDTPLPGAARWVRSLERAGATIVYLTGRTEATRASTRAALERHQFPRGEALVMKPSDNVEDHLFKEAALREIAAIGPVRLGIDNEPIQINHLADAFPEALAVWMHTDHSFRPVEPSDDLPVLRGFLMTSDRAQTQES